MAIKHIVDDALKKPMSRKEFLGQVGAVFLAIIGVTSVMHALTGANHSAGIAANTRSASDPAGYGSMPYGGSTEG